MKLFKKVKNSFYADQPNGSQSSPDQASGSEVRHSKEQDNLEDKQSPVNGANSLTTSASSTPSTPNVGDSTSQQVVVIKEEDKKDETQQNSGAVVNNKPVDSNEQQTQQPQSQSQLDQQTQTSKETNTSPQPQAQSISPSTNQSTNQLESLPPTTPQKQESPNKEHKITSSPSSMALKSVQSDHSNANSIGSNGNSNGSNGGGFFSKLKKLYKGKESAGDKKSFKGNDSGQQATHAANNGQNTPPPHHVPLHLQDEKVEREVIYIKNLEDLPEDCQKLMRVSGIPEEKFRQNLQTLLYVLHFRTGKIFKLQDELPREPRKKFVSDRFSDGESLLDNVDPAALKKLYKDTDQVGKGGFGTVYFAKSTRDKKTVAIKKMPHITKRQQIQNYREASILSKCNHPNIVKLITLHVDKEQNLWLIMEFMEGGTFEEAAKAWRFNENNLAYVARELLKGLQYLHENGMVHRDLKSANIMMSVEGKVKLIDFGLCEDISTGSPCHMVGSPFWMPPEMIHQKPHSTPVDIWSFAVSLLEMANQRPPMMESAVKAMFTVATEGATGFDHPELWSDCFKDFLSLCLKPEPSERATAVQLLQHPFIKRADTRDNMENILKKIFLTNSLMNSGF